MGSGDVYKRQIPIGPAGEPAIAATARIMANATPTITNRVFILYAILS